MPSPQEVLDRCADGTPYASLSTDFLEFDRPAGDDPLLLVATAAAATTGQAYATGVRPTVDQFESTLIESGRVSTLDDLATLDPADEGLQDIFGAERSRIALLEMASVIADRPEDDDLEALCSWAAEADVYRYETDPIGSISGVGPSSFQYLRQLAGMDTAKADPDLAVLLDRVESDAQTGIIDTAEPLRSLASCEWLSLTTEYRMIEIDCLAWWLEADEDERAIVTELE
ncbi:hypothetical protein ACLI4Y_04060 [Natrialbaceae archaeon A-CW3]